LGVRTSRQTFRLLIGGTPGSVGVASDLDGNEHKQVQLLGATEGFGGLPAKPSKGLPGVEHLSK
jgi:hypothetical protein